MEAGEADWWCSRLEPWGGDGIRFLVPSGFDAITRLFHPVERSGEATTTWRELAETNGRVAHPEMQLHAIATPAGRTPTPGSDDHPYVSEGALPLRQAEILATELARWTSTPENCWFGVWDGYGLLHGGQTASGMYRQGFGWRRWIERSEGLAPAFIRDGPRVRAPGRDYLLLRGPLRAVEEASDLLGHQVPNLWWPDDRAWFVATEIDFSWTYVAGTADMAAAIEQRSDLEAMRSDYAHSGTVDADRINT